MIIMDILSTNQGAYRLVKNRARIINETHTNYIVCPEGEFTQSIIDSGVPVISYAIKRELDLSTFKEIRDLYRILKEYRPDVVHSHNSKTGAISRVAAYLYNKRYKKKILVIHQVHGYYFNGVSGLKSTGYKMIEKLLARVTDVLLFQNKTELAMSREMRMDRHARLEYIANGISFDEFEGIKRDQSQDSHVFNILTIARIERVKNQQQTIDALNVLVNMQGRKDIMLYLIGEQSSDYHQEIKEKISRYHLDDLVTFTGMLDRETLMGYFSKGHLSVLTSIKEGKPRAIMESLYVGIPCIGTDVVGTNEVIINDFNGYLIPLNDADTLADRIAYLMDSPETRERLSQNATAYAKEHFDEVKVIERLRALYQIGR
jgi:glycosyltransferase involved in cell wall biosynthesis